MYGAICLALYLLACVSFTFVCRVCQLKRDINNGKYNIHPELNMNLNIDSEHNEYVQTNDTVNFLDTRVRARNYQCALLLHYVTFSETMYKCT